MSSLARTQGSQYNFVPLKRRYTPNTPGNCELEPRSGIQASKKQNVSSLLTCNDTILWGASVTEKYGAQPQITGFKCQILCLEQGIAMYNVSLCL